MTDKPLTTTQIQNVTLTFQEFLTQYDGKDYEWHMGEVVQKMTNNTQHNLIMGFLFQLLNLYLDMKSLGKVVLAGVPMYITDEQPAREPDLMVILNANLGRLKEKFLDGAADIAIEIVSPGSATIDRGAKFVEFEAAGVREYWIIDPIRREALFYHLSDDGTYQRIDADNTGILASSVLAGFSIDPTILWQESLPEGMAVVRMAQDLIAE